MTTTTTTEQLTGTWAIDTAHSRLGFSVRHAGIATVRGSFTGFEGELVLDGATPANSKATATVQTDTFTTGNEQRDGHIKSADFLDVETYPTVTFASTEVRPDGDDYVLVGDLTIRGVTRPVEIAVEVEGQAVDPFGNTRVGLLRRDPDQPQGLRPDLERGPRDRRRPRRRQGQDHPRHQRRQGS